MHSLLNKLTSKEIEELYLVPVWVAILVAGANKKVDNSEIKSAVGLAEEKRNKETDLIKDYYTKVADKFEVNLRGYLNLLPTDDDKRLEFLLNKLDRVNYFFSKIEKEVSYRLYLSFRDFAYKVARSSGGIFGLLSVSFAESTYIDLKMIQNPKENQS